MHMHIHQARHKIFTAPIDDGRLARDFHPVTVPDPLNPPIAHKDSLIFHNPLAIHRDYVDMDECNQRILDR